MSRADVVTLLRELLGDILELDPAQLTLEQDLIDYLDTDSLQRLELMTEVEHELRVRLDARAWREARTLAELTELTLRELAESPSR
ncbi:MAG: acyl carrier protein [Conexibacter sp.]